MNYACKVLVTGGAGFIGSWVLEELLSRYPTGTIVTIDNFFNGRREHIPRDPRITLVEADLRESGAVESIFKTHRPEVVIHLAAIHFIPYCNAHATETMDVNVVGTQSILDACRRFPPSALVAASTAAVYPVRDTPNQENHTIGPTDIYGLTKSINEQQVELFSRDCDTQCAMARISNAIGPRETNPHVVPEIVDQLILGASSLNLGNIEPKRDYVYVTDIARALIDLAERNTAKFRTYNVGTGREYSVREIVESFAELIQRPLTIVTDPNRVRKADRMHLVADLARIRTEIGWEPQVDLFKALRLMWEWNLGK